MKNKFKQFKLFKGRIQEQLPHLLSGESEDGKQDVKRLLVTPKLVLYETLYGTNEELNLTSAGNNIVTGAVVIGNPYDSFEKIIALYTHPLVRELVHSINSRSSISYGALKVSDEHYNSIKKDAFIIPGNAVLNLKGQGRSEQKIREGIWEYIAEDSRLAKDFVNLVKERLKKDFSQIMPVSLDSHKGLNLLCLHSLFFDCWLSETNLYQEQSTCSLVGMRELSYGDLEKKISRGIISALDDKKPFKYKGLVYVPAPGISIK